jgi:hypothetical protein
MRNDQRLEGRIEPGRKRAPLGVDRRAKEHGRRVREVGVALVDRSATGAVLHDGGEVRRGLREAVERLLELAPPLA